MTLLIRLVDLWHCQSSARGTGHVLTMLKEHSPNLNKYLEQLTQPHSTCRHTQLMNQLHLQLQLQLHSNLLISSSPTPSSFLSFLFATSVSVAAQNKTNCNALFAQRLHAQAPCHICLPQRQQCFASLRSMPCRARFLGRVPGCLAAWRAA